MRYVTRFLSAISVWLLVASPVLAQTDHWHFDRAVPALRDASCATASGKPNFDALSLSVTPIEANPTGLPDFVTLSGAWVLQSEDKALGGLSGLTLLDDGDLLSVSDVGTFIRIGMDYGLPTGTASKADMRFENRLIRPGKLTADAEGLDYRDGIALVSFERNFRVLAFDLGTCGSDARGIRIATPPKRFGKDRVRANAGPEALVLQADGTVTVGYEQPRSERIVTGHARADGTVRLSPIDSEPTLEPDFRLVGLDDLTLRDGGTVTVRLLRAYDRDRGNRSILHFDAPGVPALPSITLQAPMLVDNFEGITLEETDSGVRAYIISDDNFSDRQQTLLFALDIGRAP